MKIKIENEEGEPYLYFTKSGISTKHLNKIIDVIGRIELNKKELDELLYYYDAKCDCADCLLIRKKLIEVSQ